MSKLAGCVGPVKMRELELALLVVVGVAVVAIEVKVSIGARIDPNAIDLLIFVCAFDSATERQDRTSANEKRDRVNWSLDGDRLSAMHFRIRPEVVPVGSGGQVDFA